MKYAKQRTPTRYATQCFPPADGLDWSIKIFRDGRWECIDKFVAGDIVREMPLKVGPIPRSVNENG